MFQGYHLHQTLVQPKEEFRNFGIIIIKGLCKKLRIIQNTQMILSKKEEIELYPEGFTTCNGKFCKIIPNYSLRSCFKST